jgi:CRP/FNR family cyclic AMP-dependent transcriptional regulator
MQDVDALKVSGDLLAKLGSYGETRTYSRNEIVLTEGDASEGIYIVASGQMKVFTRDDRGRELVFSILRQGEIFGELFLDGGLRSASVKAITDAQCIAIHGAQIHHLIREDSDFAVALVQSLISRLRNVTQLTKSLALSGVYERVIGLLNRVAVVEGSVRTVPVEMTQQEMANRVGATREMINHILGELTRGGILRRDQNRRLTFVDDLPNRT